MLSLPSNNIAIWGCGRLGKLYYFKLRDYYNITCFYDNDIDKVGEEIIGGIKLEEYINQKNYIIIASGYWKDISKQLQKCGLKFLKDFLPVNLLVLENIRLDELLEVFNIEDIIEYLRLVKKNKNLAMIYGNCQTEFICNMLEFNELFIKDFTILRVPSVHLYINEMQINNIFYSKIINEIDLFICQNVSLENGYNTKLSTINISDQLNSKCRQIKIHNIYFDGYFIQIDNSIAKRMALNSALFLFPYWDKYIHNFKINGYSTEKIVDIISEPSFVSRDEIIDRCEKSIAELQKREKNVDVKIVYYIKERYSDNQLFYTRNHPCDQVIYEYTNNLLETLGYEKNPQLNDSELKLQFGSMKNCDWPLYPSVIHALNLKSYEKYFYTYTLMDTKLYKFDEFNREYIGRCYKKKYE